MIGRRLTNNSSDRATDRLRALAAFVRLARPLFLGGGFVGFALGAAVARFDGIPLTLAPYLWGQAIVTAFQLMVHFANDYYDQATDALTTRTRFSGGSGVLVSGELPARVALVTALLLGAAGSAVVLRAALQGEAALAIVGALTGALAWGYSAPPLRLLARGFGEADTVAVVGLLVPLLGYVAFAHGIGPHALLATLPGACAMFAMMLCVEVPDAAADAATGKRNLIVRWGAARAMTVARWAAVIAAASFPVVAAAFGIQTIFGLAAATVPAVIAGVLIVHPHLHPASSTPPLLGVLLYAATGVAALALIASV